MKSSSYCFFNVSFLNYVVSVTVFFSFFLVNDNSKSVPIFLSISQDKVRSFNGVFVSSSICTYNYSSSNIKDCVNSVNLECCNCNSMCFCIVDVIVIFNFVLFLGFLLWFTFSVIIFLITEYHYSVLSVISRVTNTYVYGNVDDTFFKVFY